MTETVDRIDLKILRALQKDGRISNADLAQAVDVSAATCHRRTQRLLEEGYVSQVRAMIDPKKINRGW
jgi:Lrp/AsnC family leucine-responsive transcriptional regulator